MNEAPLQARRSGGNLEPLDRPGVLKSQLALPAHHRFELRDPFAEVTYRSNSFEEMTIKADRLAANRFTSISPDGSRSEVSKENGQWPRPPIDRSSGTPLVPDEPHKPSGAKPSAPTRDDVPAETDDRKERSARMARLKADLNERYEIRHAPLRIGDVTIGQTEYRHRDDPARVAFTESTFRLSTGTNSPSVTRSMIDVAETRGWKAIRVSGSDDFRRMAWLEASLRNVKAIGYEPTAGDLEALRRSKGHPPEQHAERTRAPAEPTGPATAKQSARGGGRKTVLAALEAVLIARRVPQDQRDAVMKAAEQNLANRLRNGEVLRVKVYDPAAPPQRAKVVPARDVQRAQERPTPSR